MTTEFDKLKKDVHTAKYHIGYELFHNNKNVAINIAEKMFLDLVARRNNGVINDIQFNEVKEDFDNFLQKQDPEAFAVIIGFKKA